MRIITNNVSGEILAWTKNVTDAEKLIACLRELGYDAQIRPVEYREDFHGLAEAKEIRQKVDIGCHFLFDPDGKLAAVQSEYDGWVTSVCNESIEIVRYHTETIEGLGRRVVQIDLCFRDATHARKLLGLTEYRDHVFGRKVYVLPEAPEVQDGGVIHRIHFRHSPRA